MLVSPEAREYVDITVPLLFEGQNASVQRNSIALESVLDRFAVPHVIVQGSKLAVLTDESARVAAVATRRRRARRLVEIVSLVLVGAFLLSSLAFVHYGVFLIPLAVSLADPSSPHRNWLMFGALFVVAAREAWQLDLLPDDVNRVLIERFTFGLLLMLVAFWLALRNEPKKPSQLRPRSQAHPRVRTVSCRALQRRSGHTSRCANAVTEASNSVQNAVQTPIMRICGSEG